MLHAVAGWGQSRRHRRDDELPAVRSAHQPSSPVHHWTEVIVVPFLGIAGVGAHSHFELESARPNLADEFRLCRQARRDRCRRCCERRCV